VRRAILERFPAGVSKQLTFAVYPATPAAGPSSMTLPRFGHGRRSNPVNCLGRAPSSLSLAAARILRVLRVCVPLLRATESCADGTGCQRNNRIPACRRLRSITPTSPSIPVHNKGIGLGSGVETGPLTSNVTVPAASL
jgi:hypothetical protein